jgi:hypothetical protein
MLEAVINSRSIFHTGHKARTTELGLNAFFTQQFQLTNPFHDLSLVESGEELGSELTRLFRTH